MSDIIFLAGFALVLLAAVGFIFLRKSQRNAKASEFHGGNPEPGGNPLDPSIWRIGPITIEGNHSKGMPRVPLPHPEGWCFDFPQSTQAAGNVDYLTFHHGPLTGKKQVRLRYRIEAEPGVELKPADYPAYPGIITLHFQRKGDNWTGQDKYDGYRWYATDDLQVLTSGENELVVPLDGSRLWTGVQNFNSRERPEAFEAAKNEAQAVGFVLGGGDATGHGVYATGPARFVLLGFSVE